MKYFLIAVTLFAAIEAMIATYNGRVYTYYISMMVVMGIAGYNIFKDKEASSK